MPVEAGSQSRTLPPSSLLHKFFLAKLLWRLRRRPSREQVLPVVTRAEAEWESQAECSLHRLLSLVEETLPLVLSGFFLPLQSLSRHCMLMLTPPDPQEQLVGTGQKGEPPTGQVMFCQCHCAQVMLDPIQRQADKNWHKVVIPHVLREMQMRQSAKTNNNNTRTNCRLGQEQLWTFKATVKREVSCNSC